MPRKTKVSSEILLMFLLFPFIVFGLTNRTSIVTQLTINMKGVTNVIKTNVSFFTNPVYKVPPSGMEYPEVQALFQKDIFKDVFEPNTESALRRFEIEFAISLPAVLLINTLLLKIATIVQTGSLSANFSDSQNAYLYASTLFISGAIACQDYSDEKRRHEALGQKWEIFKKKF